MMQELKPFGRARRIIFSPLLADRYFLVGLILLLALTALALLAPWLTAHSPDDMDLYAIEAPPDADHLLGTDEIGRDVFSRLLYGGRVSILVALAAVFFQAVIGVSLGCIAGYKRGLADTLVMRVTDIIMCFPFYALAITLAAILGASSWNVILIIGVLHWTGIARLVRAELLSLRESGYVQAARAMGVGGITIVFRHLLRNAYAPLIVNLTLAVANAILSEAALSFIGLGVKQPQPSWGNMLAAAQSIRVIDYEWWLWIPPGLTIVLMVLAINFIGEGLSRVLNPRPAIPVKDIYTH
ncbi:ABC transporter permease [Rouxiella badensis]|jgi:peptide/nickel transport system permease protein|uniref:ABC transporter permease n=1 Tax=Rouxiella badensis TaxID=1646377 RepID=UPI00036FB5D3|nr:ABC transporter permease [Rouxiella badensis]MCC3735319.1 ABC transporter permease [Rouxiella badensis]MCC3760616.1 ABC transporter permease [Rouxiella badensis]WAT09793.1 ABC transporter permease [Rouxiella badensis]